MNKSVNRIGLNIHLFIVEHVIIACNKPTSKKVNFVKYQNGRFMGDISFNSKKSAGVRNILI